MLEYSENLNFRGAWEIRRREGGRRGESEGDYIYVVALETLEVEVDCFPTQEPHTLLLALMKEEKAKRLS